MRAFAAALLLVIEEREFHLARTVVFDGLDVASDIGNRVTVLRGDSLNDLHKFRRLFRPCDEKQALRSALPAVLPVGHVGRPRVAEQRKDLSSQSREARKSFIERQLPKFVFHEFL